MRKLLPLWILLSLTACVVNEGSARLIDTRELTLPVETAERVVVDVTGGSLEIRGEPRDDVQLKAEFWGEVYNDDSATALLANLELTHELLDQTLTIKTRTKMGSLGEDGWINLVVVLPSSLPVDVVDRSGDIILSDIRADVTIDDSWGDIEVSNVTGTLFIDDSSGTINVLSVSGGLKVDDGRGDLTIEDVGANVSIEDTSGDILVTEVAGSVLIEDGSGDIVVRVVEGDFEVTANRRGDIVHEDVKGTVTVPERRRR